MYGHRARVPAKSFRVVPWPKRQAVLVFLVFTCVICIKLWSGLIQQSNVETNNKDWNRQVDYSLDRSEIQGIADGKTMGPHSPSPSPSLPSAREGPRRNLPDEQMVTKEGNSMYGPPPPSSPTFSMPAPPTQPKKHKAGEQEKTTGKRSVPVLESPSKEMPLDTLSDMSCRIHVLDLGNDLAPSIGMPGCNITDIWPFDHPGSGIGGMRRTSHQDAPHAMGYWLANAVRNSIYYEESMDKADLILLDSHCYESWYFVAQHTTPKYEEGLDPMNDISLDISRLFVEGVTSSLQFTRSKGKKFVIVRPTLGAPPGVMLDTCAKFKSSFFVASERGVFCDNDRDRAFLGKSVILPPVINGYLSEANAPEILPVEKRHIMLYLRIPCFDESIEGQIQNHVSPNLLLLQSIEKSIFKGNLGNRDDIVIVSRQESCRASPSEQASSIRMMRSSRYCGILPAADRQTTIELPLAIHAGCIPVFLGPPFHSMPMALDVEYSKIAVFIHIVDHTKAIWKLDDLNMQDGDLEPDEAIHKAPIEVPDVLDAIKHLQNIPATVAGELHDQVVMQVDKFSYGSNSDATSAVDVAIDRMCKYSIEMKQENQRKARQKIPLPPVKHS